MPWKESGPVEERMIFVTRILNGERMTDLCREFGISRKTGYKFLQRYTTKGIDGLQDLSLVLESPRHHGPPDHGPTTASTSRLGSR